MEYIKNGNFENGSLENWDVQRGSVTPVEEGGRYHVVLGRDVRLSQTFDGAAGQFATVSLEVQVVNGPNRPTGDLEFLLYFQGGTDPGAPTFAINEPADWQTHTQIVQLHGGKPSLLEFITQHDINKIIKIRNLSVVGEAH
ncbi:MAG: hypothetical protein JWP80_2252 [Pseudomonas sp.]|nr:hypothetical protein [Pseudomonas sp.]